MVIILVGILFGLGVVFFFWRWINVVWNLFFVIGGICIFVFIFWGGFIVGGVKLVFWCGNRDSIILFSNEGLRVLVIGGFEGCSLLCVVLYGFLNGLLFSVFSSLVFVVFLVVLIVDLRVVFVVLYVLYRWFLFVLFWCCWWWFCVNWCFVVMYVVCSCVSFFDY